MADRGKTTPLKLLALATGLLAQTPPLPAQEGRAWVLAQGAYLAQDPGSDVRNGPALGTAMGCWLTDRWGLEGSGAGATLTSTQGPVRRHETQLNGSLLFALTPWTGSRLPYLRLGLGAASLERPLGGEAYTGPVGGHSVRLAVHGAAGAQWRFQTRWLVSGEVRLTSLPVPSGHRELAGFLGVGRRWGAPDRPAQVLEASAPLLPPPSAQASLPVPLPAPEGLPALTPPTPAPSPLPIPPPPPPPPAPGPLPNPAPAPVPKVELRNDTEHFRNGQASLGAGARRQLRDLAERLKGFKGDYLLSITGHTSQVGSRAFNLALSLKRAEVVAEALVAEGVPRSALRMRGVGSDEPLVPERTEEDRARNRRVEIEMLRVPR